MGLITMIAWLFILSFALILLGELETIKNLIYIIGIASILGVVGFIIELFDIQPKKHNKSLKNYSSEFSTNKKEDESYSEYTERVKNYRKT